MGLDFSWCLGLGDGLGSELDLKLHPIRLVVEIGFRMGLDSKEVSVSMLGLDFR